VISYLDDGEPRHEVIVSHHLDDGRIFLTHECADDLVSPWIDAPVVDWSKERDWVKAIAMDQSGLWFRYEELPVADYGCGTWDSDGRRVQNMHPSEYPQFTGNWKDSLCVRPEGGAK
jgi:hypothetical protein